MSHTREIESMKAWALEHYEQGGDLMVESWTDADYQNLFTHSETGTVLTTAEAWKVLKNVAGWWADQAADAINSEF